MRKFSGTLVSVAQDEDGQHRFIRMSDAIEGRSLQVLSEVEAKQVGGELLYARLFHVAACRDSFL